MALSDGNCRGIYYVKIMFQLYSMLTHVTVWPHLKTCILYPIYQKHQATGKIRTGAFFLRGGGASASGEKLAVGSLTVL